MSEFQIGLLIAGALAIGAVLVYNALQEHNARRQADRAFGSRHPDALMQGEPASHEARRGPAGPAPPASQPDPAVDYIVELALRAPADSQSVVAQLESVERRFGRRAAFHVSGSRVSAALQLASRDGPVSEADLIEFRASLENVAAQSGAKIAAPEMKHAVEGARELDRLCAEADIQVAFHLVPGSAEWDEAGALQASASLPYAVGARHPGLTFALDVARTADARRAYEAMARHARQLAEQSLGTLVDDNAAQLDERAIAAIGAQVDAVCRTLEARGIAPGGSLALRLFS